MSRRRQDVHSMASNRAGDDGSERETRALSESPRQPKGIFAESELEVEADALVTERGGMAGVEELDEPEGGRLKKRGLGALFWVSLGWVGLLVFSAIFAKWLHLPDPNATDSAARRLGMTSHHLLGTDQLGRDQLSRVIYGA